MSEMASVARETASAAHAAAESDAPSRLRDNNGHNGMHPIYTQGMGVHNKTKYGSQPRRRVPK